jgi:hypothetical protein
MSNNIEVSAMSLYQLARQVRGAITEELKDCLINAALDGKTVITWTGNLCKDQLYELRRLGFIVVLKDGQYMISFDISVE